MAFKPKAVLFDLDGCLVDTAPDLALALNAVLQQQQRPSLPFDIIRPHVSNGASALIQLGFGEQITTDEHEAHRQSLISFYQDNVATHSHLFEGMDQLLNTLEQHACPWGIATNKPRYLTHPLLEALHLSQRAHSIVCADDVAQPKPHPQMLETACQNMNITPSDCVYLGDASRDIEAGQRAQMQTVACRFGYLTEGDDINQWGADLIIDAPTDLLKHYQF